MGTKSKIEWTDDTWNPVTGCDKVSQGCKHCYAEIMANRLQAMGEERVRLALAAGKTPAPNRYADGFKLTLQPSVMDLPLRTTRPRFYFVNSMSDLFHKDIPIEYLQQVFAVMQKAHWHRFQVLTKRAERLAEIAHLLPWPPNVWMGVSVENRATLGRVDCLRQVPAKVRFLSIEPLLESLEVPPKEQPGLPRAYGLHLAGIHWVIVGGESQPGCRPMDPAWAQDIVDQCRRCEVACFVKQLGGHPNKRADITTFPTGLQVREMPRVWVTDEAVPQ